MSMTPLHERGSVLAWSAIIGRKPLPFTDSINSPAGNAYLTFVSGGVKEEGREPERWGMESSPTEALRNLIRSINDHFPGKENVSWRELPELRQHPNGQFYWLARLVCE